MSYDVVINRLPISALFDLKGERAIVLGWAGDVLPDFPDAPNTRTQTDGMSFANIGPNHWLLRADIAHEDRLEAALNSTKAPPEISIVKLSDSLCFFRVIGPDAAQVISIGCPLDLHDSRFPADAATFTEFFGLKALVTRYADGFDVAVDQSYADMIADYLARAVA